MSRDIQQVLKDATEDPVIQPFYTVELFLDTNIIRTWTGYGQIIIDGLPFEGTGELLSISSIEETSEIAASGITLNLSSIPQDLLAVALSEPYQGRMCKVYFGFFSENVSTPVRFEIFSGYMDEMNILESEETSTIELRVENKLIDLERPRIRRYTSQDQKSEYPSDVGFDFMETLQDKVVVWRGKN